MPQQQFFCVERSAFRDTINVPEKFIPRIFKDAENKSSQNVLMLK